MGEDDQVDMYEALYFEQRHGRLPNTLRHPYPYPDTRNINTKILGPGGHWVCQKWGHANPKVCLWSYRQGDVKSLWLHSTQVRLSALWTACFRPHCSGANIWEGGIIGWGTSSSMSRSHCLERASSLRFSVPGKYDRAKSNQSRNNDHMAC